MKKAASLACNLIAQVLSFRSSYFRINEKCCVYARQGSGDLPLLFTLSTQVRERTGKQYLSAEKTLDLTDPRKGSQGFQVSRTTL